MILSYADRRASAFARGERVREFAAFDRQGWKRLEIIHAATGLGDLQALPSNRLEALRGDRQGQFSIRVNAQWRICFMWVDGEPGPSQVAIVDHH